MVTSAGVRGLSVVIPCYNEEDSLHATHERVSAAARKQMGDDYEIVFVNDGSTDSTWPILHTLASTDSHVVSINLSRNHGQQLALTAGLSMCRGARILIIDADLQDPPELLPDMMALMDQGADVVYGQRMNRQGETWFKKLCSKAFYRILNRLIDVHIPMDTGDFRLMSRRALDILNGMPERHRYIRGMISWIGFKQVPLGYERKARFAGKTKYGFFKLFRLAVEAITSFSTVPLRFASQLGMLLGCLAVVYLIYALTSWARGIAVEGWTSLISIVLIIGSIQLFVIGILGEYVGRMFMETKQRPIFMISEIVVSGQSQIDSHQPAHPIQQGDRQS